MEDDKQRNKSTRLTSLISKHRGPQLCHLCFKTRFKERWSGEAMEVVSGNIKLMRWKLPHYWQDDCGKGLVLDGKG